MEEVRVHFPYARVIWADILPRVFYFGARSQKSMERQRKAINRAARAHAEIIGCGVLHHPQFTRTDLSLFRFDGIHLSVAGNRAFCQDLTNCFKGCGSV